MKVTPRTEEEIKIMKLLPDGDYNFNIIESSDKVSKSGNEMVHIVLNIEHNNKFYLIHDYLLENDMMLFKIRHCCEGLGLIDKYNSGEISASDFIGKKGKVRLMSKSDKNGIYDTKNVVKDYLEIDSINEDMPF